MAEPVETRTAKGPPFPRNGGPSPVSSWEALCVSLSRLRGSVLQWIALTLGILFRIGDILVRLDHALFWQRLDDPAVGRAFVVRRLRPPEEHPEGRPAPLERGERGVPEHR